MSNEKKVVKGGLRASLALLISIIALILAIIAFNRTGGNEELNLKIRDLQTKIEKMKKETSEQVGKVREETSKTLESLSKIIKKKEGGQ